MAPKNLPGCIVLGASSFSFLEKREMTLLASPPGAAFEARNWLDFSFLEKRETRTGKVGTWGAGKARSVLCSRTANTAPLECPSDGDFSI